MSQEARCSLTIAAIDFHYGSASRGAFRLKIPATRFEGGQVIGITGRSGEGKSTLLHVVGLLQPAPEEFHLEIASGDDRVEVTDETPDRMLGRVRNRFFGYIFQEDFLLPHFDALGNATLPLALRQDWGAGRRQAEGLLGSLGIDGGLEGKTSDELSGGQNQRVSVSRAFVHSPPFVLADEPTANLDVTNKHLVLRHLRREADAGRCVILVSHELGDLAQYCDRILVVSDGGISSPFADELGSPDGPVLPPVPGIGGRTNDVIKPIVAALSGQIWGAAPARGQHDGREAPESSPASAELPSGDIPVVGFGARVLRYALMDTLSRRQWGFRAIVASILAVASFCFFYLHDLGQGTVEYVRDHALRENEELINRIEVDVPSSRKGGLTAAERSFMNGLTGLASAPTYRLHDPSWHYQQPEGRDRTVSAYSVPIGDPWLAPMADGSSRAGVTYLAGGPFTEDDRNRAGMIVSIDFLREKVWKGKEIDRAQLLAPIEVIAKADAGHKVGGRGIVPGFSGRLDVPVKGVFEYREGWSLIKDRLPHVFVPEGFLWHYQTERWQPHWSFFYERIDRRILVEDIELVTAFAIDVDGATSDDWRRPVSRALKRVFLVTASEQEGGGLKMTLNPVRVPRQRITPEELEPLLEKAITRRIEEAGGTSSVRVLETVAARQLFRGPGDMPEEIEYENCILRFEEIDDVLPAYHELTSRFPELELDVRHLPALQTLSTVRSIVEIGTMFLMVIFVATLLFLIVTTSYMHITGKTGDVGILRTYGLAPGKIAVLFQVELLLLVLPASLLGVVLAIGAGSATNDWLSGTIGEITRAAASGEAEATTAVARSVMTSAPIFRTQQVDLAESLLEIGKIAAVVVACVALTSFLSIRVLQKSTIVQCLRTSST